MSTLFRQCGSTIQEYARFIENTKKIQVIYVLLCSCNVFLFDVRFWVTQICRTSGASCHLRLLSQCQRVLRRQSEKHQSSSLSLVGLFNARIFITSDFLGIIAKAFSDSAYCDMLPHVVCVSASLSLCLSGRLSHLCTLLTLLDKIRCHLVGTLLWSQVMLY